MQTNEKMNEKCAYLQVVVEHGQEIFRFSVSILFRGNALIVSHGEVCPRAKNGRLSRWKSCLACAGSLPMLLGYSAVTGGV